MEHAEAIILGMNIMGVAVGAAIGNGLVLGVNFVAAVGGAWILFS